MKKKWLSGTLVASLLATCMPFGSVEAASLEALPAFRARKAAANM